MILMLNTTKFFILSSIEKYNLPFNIVHDFVLQVQLPLICRDIKGHLALDDALTDVLNSSSFWWRSCQVNELVDLKMRSALHFDKIFVLYIKHSFISLKKL